MRLLAKWLILYSVLAAVTTASISSFARALCLPPYWPAEYVFRCRPGGFAPALLLAFREAAVSAVVMGMYSLPIAALIVIAIHVLQPRISGLLLRGLASTAGGGAWIWIMRKLEPSTLDFKVGWYATAAGAAVAATVAWLAARPRTPAPQR